jgi:hypothetical protein
MKQDGHSPWQVQIYRMSDERAQAAAATLLTSAGFNFDERTCERGAFLIVDCSEPADPLTVYQTVLLCDPDAELIHSTIGPRASALPV